MDVRNTEYLARLVRGEVVQAYTLDIRDAEHLARFRVSGKGNINYRAEHMNAEEQNIRRTWIRKHLTGTQFQNRNNDYIDGMRLELDHNIGGMWIEDIDGYLYHTKCQKVSEEDSQFRKSRAMMPFEFLNASGKDFDWTRYGMNVDGIKRTVNEFLARYEEFQEKGMGLYIYSAEKGSGKTMLSCCLLNEISKRYIGSIKFVNTLNFLEMTKKGYHYDNPDVESLYVCRTLVIDDIGVQLDKGWVDTVFYRLINTRYENRKPTIYTSNLQIADLKMDDRIKDRIDSTCFEVHLPEVPVRRIIRKEEKERMMFGADVPKPGKKGA